MPDLAWWLENFERSAFRLECLPQYLVPQEVEMLAAFKRGEEVRLANDHAWLKLIRSCMSNGRSMRRVRVVSHPLSEYLHFEMSLYSQCVAAGEEIRVSETHFADDFWLFDDQTVIILQYDSAGRFLGTEQAEDVVPFRRQRDLALEYSIPLADFLARAAGD